MATVTHDDIFRAVKALTSVTSPITMSTDVKRWLDAAGIEWDRPQGWRIKDAEVEESRNANPRFIKYKCGPHENSQVGFALAEYVEAADAAALEKGWKRL